MDSMTALVIIDVQTGMFDITPPLFKGNDLLAIIKTLISQARSSNIPIIYVQHDGGSEKHPLHPSKQGWSIHPDIYPAKGEVVIRKRHPDSFQETNLQKELDALVVKDLIVAGIQTEYCVDTTCRRAYSLGYKVVLVQDAHSTWDTENLKAEQIIAHHNQTLSDWFVSLRPANQIQF